MKRTEGKKKVLSNTVKAPPQKLAARRVKKSKQSSTYLTQEEARRNVTPMLNYASQLVRRNKLETVPGWLNRLGQWLIRMERGNYHDARTPFFARMSYQQIAGMIMSIVLNNAVSRSKFYSSPSYYKIYTAVEEHQSEKISGRGLFPPAHVWINDKIHEVWSDKPPLPTLDRKALDRALEWLSGLLPAGCLKVDVESINEGFKTADSKDQNELSLNVDTNSCFPTYVRHWYHRIWDKSVDVVHRLVQYQLVTQARNLWTRMLKAKSWKECTIHLVHTANQRTNVGSGWKLTSENTYKGHPVSKLRFVSAAPKIDTILGKPILNRLMPACRSIKNSDGTRPFCALMRPEIIDKNMQVALETATSKGVIPLGTDFSHYDASVPPWLAFEVAKAVSRWMEPKMANIWLGLVYSEFYLSSCIAPTRFFKEGPSSMKSGTIFTNILDSLINLTSQRYGLEAGFYEEIYNHFVQGDDAILIGKGVNPKSFEACVSTLGFEGNASKQFYEKDSVSFCQKIYLKDYPGGIYPIARATAACVSLEDDVGIETDEVGQFPYVLAFRTVCRLGSACFNPNFVPLINLFANDDRLLHLGRDMPADKLAKLAGSYATKMKREWIDKPWKNIASHHGGFSAFPVNRVLRGELPPPPGKALFEWVYGVRYEDVPLYENELVA